MEMDVRTLLELKAKEIAELNADKNLKKKGTRVIYFSNVLEVIGHMP